MRNPIQPSPERPIPLPDRILMDAWWVDLKAETMGRPRAALSLVPDPAKLRLSGTSAAGAAGR